MDIKLHEVQGLGVIDESGEALYQVLFSEYDPAYLYRQAIQEQEDVSIVDDKLVFFKRLEEIGVVMYSRSDQNEVVVFKALECFSAALFKLLKRCTKEYVLKKYDLLCLLTNTFVFKGIICERDPEKLLKKVPARSFEGLETMNIPKGFLSFFSDAKKSIKKRTG